MGTSDKITNWYTLGIIWLVKNALMVFITALYIKGLADYFSKTEITYLSISTLEWLLITFTTFLIYTFLILIIKIYDKIFTVDNNLKVIIETQENISNNIDIIKNKQEKMENSFLDSINIIKKEQKEIRKFLDTKITKRTNDDISEISKYDTKIIKKLFLKEDNSVKYIKETLGLGVSVKLEGGMLDNFREVCKYKFAKACCVVSDKKYIEYDYTTEDGKEEIMKLLSYFSDHKEIIEENLVVNRIFSFEAKSSHIDVDKKQSLNILLYMIINYISGVNVYLHLYDKKECGIYTEDNSDKNTEPLFCINLDYVALMWFDTTFKYNSFFTTHTSDQDLIAIKDNDIMLHKFLEDDYVSRASASRIYRPRTPVLAYCIKLNINEFDTILDMLNLSKETIETDLINILENEKGFKGDVEIFLYSVMS